ncbi:hypothetical protein QTP88_009948 [Uroleucon formosanum]
MSVQRLGKLLCISAFLQEKRRSYLQDGGSGETLKNPPEHRRLGKVALAAHLATFPTPQTYATTTADEAADQMVTYLSAACDSCMPPRAPPSTEKHHEYNKDINLVFVDFKQAYDNINRNKLWTALKKFGIPEKLARLIKMCNSNTQNVVRIMGEISEPFIVKNGLRQGDALSPVLFNLALEEIIRSLPRGQRMKMNEGYTCLACADDLVLLGDTRQDVIQILSDLMKASKQMSLLVVLLSLLERKH